MIHTALALGNNDELLTTGPCFAKFIVVYSFPGPNQGKLWIMKTRTHLGDYESSERSHKARVASSQTRR